MGEPMTADPPRTSVLADTDLTDPATRLDVIREDQYRRWHAGDRVPAERYVALLPPAAREDALVVIWAEVRLRAARGEAPLVEEYQGRFPEYAELLARQFELELLMGSLAGGTVTRAPGPQPVGDLTSPPGYEVVGELGRGAMGVVYKARQVALGRTVALKVLRGGDAADADREARFHREAALAGRLHHPNIAQVFAYGLHGGRAFIVMEFVEGRTLAHAADRPRPANEAARQVETLATAVQFAHSNGVVHRDLKPANVLVARDGQLKIVDFGLAKELDDASSRTLSGAILGTPAYMAPEQAGGRAPVVGPATDVWALGAILYDLLTGRPPFHGASPMATLQQVLTTQPPPPSRTQPDLPRDLETICLKCLEKDPARRYASAAALADDLRRFQAGESIRARPVRAHERTWRWCRRNPAWAAMLSAAAVLLTVTAVGGVIMSVRLSAALERSRTDSETADERLWESRVARARLIRRDNGLNARRDALDLLRTAAATRVTPELRNEFVAALALPDVSVARGFDGWPAEAVGLAFSADFGRYVRADSTNVLTVRRTEGDVEVARVVLPGPAAVRVWMGPDGRTVGALYGVPGEPRFRVGVWNEGPDGFRQVWEAGGFESDTPATFRADGRGMAVLNTATGDIHILDPAAGPVRPSFSIGPVPNWIGIAYHPRLDCLAVTGTDGVRVFDLATGAGSEPLRIPGARAVASVAWHPEAETLLLAWLDSSGWKVGTWDPAGRKPLAVCAGPVRAAPFGALDPAGRLIVANDWSDSLRVFDAASGLPLFHVPQSTSQGVRFSPDGGLLGPGIVGREVRLYHAAPSPVFRTLTGPTEPRSWVLARVDHDNRLLAVGTGTELQFWDLDTLALLASEKSDHMPRSFDAPRRLFGTGSGWVGDWHVAWDPAAATRATVRFNALLFPFNTPNAYSVTRRVVVGSDHQRVHVGFPDLSRWPVRLPHADARCLVVSPDNRWVATCSHFSTPGDPASVKVWDVSGKMSRPAKELAVGHAAHAAFGPDGRWLATATLLGGCRLWRVGSWEAGPEVGGNFPLFAPDGRTVVTETGQGEIRLCETETGREVVRLAAPLPTRVRPLCFSPDGNRLVVWGQDTNAIHVWELGELRARLRADGLDW